MIAATEPTAPARRSRNIGHLACLEKGGASSHGTLRWRRDDRLAARPRRRDLRGGAYADNTDNTDNEVCLERGLHVRAGGARDGTLPRQMRGVPRRRSRGRESAPALAGGPFGQRWDGATLKKLFERLEEMPPDDAAARLAPTQYVDVLAFLLSVNNIPAGTTALVADKDALAAIKYTSQRPKF